MKISWCPDIFLRSKSFIKFHQDGRKDFLLPFQFQSIFAQEECSTMQFKQSSVFYFFFQNHYWRYKSPWLSFMLMFIKCMVELFVSNEQKRQFFSCEMFIFTPNIRPSRYYFNTIATLFLPCFTCGHLHKMICMCFVSRSSKRSSTNLANSCT